MMNAPSAICSGLVTFPVGLGNSPAYLKKLAWNGQKVSKINDYTLNQRTLNKEFFSASPFMGQQRGSANPECHPAKRIPRSPAWLLQQQEQADSIGLVSIQSLWGFCWPVHE